LLPRTVVATTTSLDEGSSVPTSAPRPRCDDDLFILADFLDDFDFFDERFSISPIFSAFFTSPLSPLVSRA
jgi:hypothetical protein